MDIIMTLTYVAIIIVIFKVFRVPATKWTVTTAVLGGFFILSWIYISMAFFHPYTPHAKIYFLTTPISSQERGKVVKVFVTDNRPLKKGDPLFQIDPVPFQATVNQLKAKLTFAELRLKERSILFEKQAGRKFDVEHRQAQVNTLKAELARALFDLNKTIVRAPTDGLYSI